MLNHPKIEFKMFILSFLC